MPVINLVLLLQGKVVAIRRNIDPFRGTLAFPGGYIDHSEDWRLAALRELAEELGLDYRGTEYARTLRLIGPPLSTKTSNFLVLFATMELPKELRLEDIPAYADPERVSAGEISEVLLIDLENRDKVRLGVPAHQTVWASLYWDRYQSLTGELSYCLPPMEGDILKAQPEAFT